MKKICKNTELDIVFLVDGSDSIAVPDFEKIKSWISKMVTTLKPEELDMATHAMVTQYSDIPKIEVDETFDSDSTVFERKVSLINQMAMGTNTFSALKFLRSNVLPR